ncbi:MAG TPA: alpha/beta hydrolase [Thermoanaerobaculia bacterium]|nr:alpha/beta hydrolase [Thermoanaerobaculia bacterium]
MDWLPGRPRWLPRWLGNVVAAGVTLFAVIGLAGACYEHLSLARAERHAPGAAEMIDVGGYRLHLRCAGTGSPVVVMDAALGESMRTWDKVWPAVAKTTRICMFDRAGMGWSDAGPLPRTSARMADELRILLTAAHVEGPYILVGHSLGGLNMRLFAGRNAKAIAGIVLVDSGHPEQFRRMPAKSAHELADTIHRLRWLIWTAPFGLPRLLGLCGGEPQPHCSLYLKTALAEFAGLPQTIAEVSQVRTFGDTPLIVLSQDPHLKTGWMSEEEKATWNELQVELLRLSSNSSRVIAPQSHHFIQWVRPDLVIAAITHLVESTRATTKSR